MIRLPLIGGMNMSYLYNYLHQRVKDERFMLYWSQEEEKVHRYVHKLQDIGFTLEAAEKEVVLQLEKCYQYIVHTYYPSQSQPSTKEFLLLA